MTKRGAFEVKKAPHGWRDNFILLAAAVAEIGKALHRIADALEQGEQR